jgi:hypothetical protein
MAIKINSQVNTVDGFTVEPFVFLDIQLYKPFSRAVLTYYKDQTAFENGASSVQVQLPMSVEVELKSGDFFGPNLAMLFHDKAVVEIEKITGSGTCQIIQ